MAADMSAASPPPSLHEDEASDHGHANDENAAVATEGAGRNNNGTSSMESILLDIAFLHSIATHRPIGPHKHFNVIPILVNLERTARQVGARLRDDSYMNMRADSSDAAQDTTKKAIKQEDEMMVHGNGNNEAITATTGSTSSSAFHAASTSIDSKYVWEKLNDLYDVEGLEELVSC